MIALTEQSVRTLLASQAACLPLPTPEGDIEAFELRRGLVLHPGFKLFYRAAASVDAISDDLISVWPLDAIRRVQSGQHGAASHLYSIGDIMLNSDQIIADISKKEAPVTLRYGEQTYAANFDASLSVLLGGNPQPCP